MCENPNAEQIAEMTLMAAAQVKHLRFIKSGITVAPQILALVSAESAKKNESCCSFNNGNVGGNRSRQEMHGDSALSEGIRHEANPDSPLKVKLTCS